MSAALKPGEVLLLENVRFYPEEEGKPILPETATDEEKKAAKAELKARQKELAKKLQAMLKYLSMMHSEQHTGHRVQQPLLLIISRRIRLCSDSLSTASLLQWIRL